MTPKYIAELFDLEPQQWGLRGDPLLWRDMREHFRGRGMPPTATELESEIRVMFKYLTDHDLSEVTHFHVKKYESHGMSSGGIAPSFWRESAIPFLKSRFEGIR